MGLIAAFVPIWILAAAGYFAQRRGLLAGNASLVLGQFVFYLAIPAALFLTLAKDPLSGFALRPLLAFVASTVIVMVPSWYAAGRWLGRKPAERPVWAMAAGYVNSANLGIPIALQVIGNVSFLVEVVLFQTLIVTPVILVALDRQDDAAGRVRLSRIASLPVRNPVILASALGVIASATRFQLPPLLHGPVALLGAAGVPTALVALGASLHPQRTPAGQTPATPASPPEPATSPGSGRPARSAACAPLAGPPASAASERAEIAAIVGLKLLAQPAIAYAIGAFALHLPPPELLAVVVCAGLPTAQNAFIYAQRYRAAEAFIGRAMLVTTTLSMATIAALALLLGR